MKARIVLAFVLTAALLAVSSVWAQSDGGFTVGGGFWSQTNPEAKFLEYRDLPRGGFLADYMLRQFSGSWAGAVWGQTPTRFDQQDAMYLAKGVRWRLDASFNGVPHRFSEVARSPYVQTSTGVFTLSDSLQRQIQNLTQSAANPSQNRTLQELLRNSPGVALAIQTDVTKVRLRGRPMKDWQFEVRGSDRERSGSQAMGTTEGGPGGPTVELPAPIDQRTLDVDASATYAHGPARVMVTLGLSNFKNRIEAIRFDNFRVFNSDTTRSVVNQMAAAPDNNLLRGRIVGSWQLPYASTFTATIGVSQTTQKQDFLPMTVNPFQLAKYGSTGLLDLERGNLDGKVTDVVQDYRLTGRPFANFYGTLRFRQEKMDDQTPTLGLPNGFINYDQGWSRGAVESEAASNTKTIYGLDADYSLGKRADVSILVEGRQRELPDWREVTKDAEGILGGKLTLRPLDNLDASVGYQYGQRRMDSFILDAYDGAEWPLFRRYDVADRNQSKLNGEISWSPVEKLDLSVSGWWSKDDYPNSTWGLQSVDNTQVFGEGTVHAVRNLDLSGGFGYGLQKSDQASIENGTSVVADTTARAPWTANLEDKSVYAFARADWWAKSRKLQVTADYTFTRDMQTYDFSNYWIRSAAGILPAATTTAIDLPSDLYRMNDAALTAKWHYSPQFDLGCTYGYTQYDVADALYQNIPYVNVNPTNAGSAATAIFLGNGKLNYTAHRFQVFATRRF